MLDRSLPVFLYKHLNLPIYPSIFPSFHFSIHPFTVGKKAPPSIMNSYSLPSSFIRPSARPSVSIHPSIRGSKQDLFPFFLFSKASEAEVRSNMEQKKIHSFIHSGSRSHRHRHRHRRRRSHTCPRKALLILLFRKREGGGLNIAR